MFALPYMFDWLQHFGYYKAIADPKKNNFYSNNHLREEKDTLEEEESEDGLSTQISNFILGSKLWNALRRNLTNTDINHIESVVSIHNNCRRPTDRVYCYHKVSYIYNGVEQEEEFSSHDIVRMCKRLGLKMSPHFSEESWCKEIGIPHSEIPLTREAKTQNRRPIKII